MNPFDAALGQTGNGADQPDNPFGAALDRPALSNPFDVALSAPPTPKPALGVDYDWNKSLVDDSVLGIPKRFAQEFPAAVGRAAQSIPATVERAGMGLSALAQGPSNLIQKAEAERQALLNPEPPQVSYSPPTPQGFQYEFAPPAEGSQVQDPDAQSLQQQLDRANITIQTANEARDTLGASVARDAAMSGLLMSGAGTGLAAAGMVGIPAVLDAGGKATGFEGALNQGADETAALLKESLADKKGKTSPFADMLSEIYAGITKELPNLGLLATGLKGEGGMQEPAKPEIPGARAAVPETEATAVNKSIDRARAKAAGEPRLGTEAPQATLRTPFPAPEYQAPNPIPGLADALLPESLKNVGSKVANSDYSVWGGAKAGVAGVAEALLPTRTFEKLRTALTPVKDAMPPEMRNVFESAQATKTLGQNQATALANEVVKLPEAQQKLMRNILEELPREPLPKSMWTPGERNTLNGEKGMLTVTPENIRNRSAYYLSEARAKVEEILPGETFKPLKDLLEKTVAMQRLSEDVIGLEPGKIFNKKSTAAELAQNRKGQVEAIAGVPEEFQGPLRRNIPQERLPGLPEEQLTPIAERMAAPAKADIESRLSQVEADLKNALRPNQAGRQERVAAAENKLQELEPKRPVLGDNPAPGKVLQGTGNPELAGAGKREIRAALKPPAPPEIVTPTKAEVAAFKPRPALGTRSVEILPEAGERFPTGKQRPAVLPHGGEELSRVYHGTNQEFKAPKIRDFNPKESFSSNIGVNVTRDIEGADMWSRSKEGGIPRVMEGTLKGKVWRPSDAEWDRLDNKTWTAPELASFRQGLLDKGYVAIDHPYAKETLVLDPAAIKSPDLPDAPPKPTGKLVDATGELINKSAKPSRLLLEEHAPEVARIITDAQGNALGKKYEAERLQNFISKNKVLPPDQLQAIFKARDNLRKQGPMLDKAAKDYVTLIQEEQRNFLQGGKGHVRKEYAEHVDQAAEKILKGLELGESNFSGRPRADLRARDAHLTARDSSIDMERLASPASPLYNQVTGNFNLAAAKQMFEGSKKTPFVEDAHMDPTLQGHLEAQGWKQLPDSDLYGPLAGHHVDPRLYNALDVLHSFHQDLPSNLAHMTTWMAGMKAAKNPASLMANVMGSMWAAWTELGIRADEIPGLLKVGAEAPNHPKWGVEIQGQGVNNMTSTRIQPAMGAVSDTVRKAGLGDFLLDDAKRKTFKDYLPEFDRYNEAVKQKKAGERIFMKTFTDGVDTAMTMARKVTEPIIGKGYASLLDPAKLGEVFADFENIVRNGSYIKLRERGYTPEAARQKISDAYVDYTNISPAVQNLRQFKGGLGNRFMQWTAHQTDRGLHNATNLNPLTAARFWAPAMAFQALNQHARDQAGETEKQTKTRLSQMQSQEGYPGRLWMLEGWDKDAKHMNTLDFGRVNPYNQLFATISDIRGQLEGVPGVNTTGTLAQPSLAVVPLIEAATNRRLFYPTKKIRPEEDNPLGEPRPWNVRPLIEHMLESYAPPQYGRYLTTITRQLRGEDSFGTRQLRGIKLRDSDILFNMLSGLRLTEFDPELAKESIGKQMQQMVQDAKGMRNMDITKEEFPQVLQALEGKLTTQARRLGGD